MQFLVHPTVINIKAIIIIVFRWPRSAKGQQQKKIPICRNLFLQSLFLELELYNNPLPFLHSGLFTSNRHICVYTTL